jgi:hemerythrin
MALIQWKNDFSVNVAEIDKQHQKLIDLINELDDAMKTGKGKDVIGRTVDGLIKYTENHFSVEEKYFDKFKYPDTYAHKMEHVAFVKKCSEFRNDFANGKLSLSIQVMDFLSTWLQNHIVKNDKKYSSCFNSNGVN